METIHLPVWAISSGKAKDQPPQPPCGGENHTAVFSTTQRLTEFLEQRIGGHWTVRAVRERSDLGSFVEELRHNGSAGIYLDPEPDGNGGTSISPDEFLSRAI